MIKKFLYFLLILQIVNEINANSFYYGSNLNLITKDNNNNLLTQNLNNLVNSLNKSSIYIISQYSNFYKSNLIKNATHTAIVLNNSIVNQNSSLLQNQTEHVLSLQNITLNNSVEVVNTKSGLMNLTSEYELQELNLNHSVPGHIYHLFSTFKLVSVEMRNNSKPIEMFWGLEQLIKHSMLKFFGSRLDSLCVELSANNTNLMEPLSSQLENPVAFNVKIRSPILISEDQFQAALIDFSINPKKCNFIKNETLIRCSIFKNKDSSSLLRLSDYWIELDQLVASSEKLNGIEYEIFSYKPSWIIGLIIIGCIIAIFFIGCIIAICYTRRPYRRCGKVYEIESGIRKNNIPQIPGVHPSTKASTVTKQKEMYYQ